jgi:hypothetical protein
MVKIKPTAPKKDHTSVLHAGVHGIQEFFNQKMLLRGGDGNNF